MKRSVRALAIGTVCAAVLATAATSASAAEGMASLIEDGAYPDAARILAEQGIQLVSGDGNIVLADCATTATDRIRLYHRPDYSRPELSSEVCFDVTASVGALTMQIANVYNIKAGQRPLDARLDTDGTVEDVEVPANTWEPVGEGETPGTTATLLELHVGSGTLSVTGAQAAVGKVTAGSRACTGTLIAPQWILSAASCFAANPDEPTALVAGVPSEASHVIFPGRNPVTVNYLVPRTDRDLVLGKLAAPITDITPVKVATAATAAGATVQAIGFGRTASAWVTNAQHTAASTVANVTATVLITSAVSGNLCKGDAGGPALNVQNELAGVYSRAGQAGCLAVAGSDSTAAATRLDDIVGWITDNSMTNILAAGQRLSSGQYLRPDSAGYTLLMQADGNLILQKADQQVWATGTAGNPGAYATVQTDGNLVVYTSTGQAIWATGTNGTVANRLTLGTDGRLILSGSDGKIYWHARAAFDGDGKPDIAAFGSDGNTLYLNRNTSTPGSPSKAAAQTVSSGWASVNSMMTVDYDGDGKADLIGRSGDALLIWLSTSTSSAWSFKNPYTTLGTGNSGVSKYLIADFDGDGKPDIAAFGSDGNTLYLNRNTSTPGSPSKAAAQTVSSGWASVNSMMTVDYDGDGKADLIGRSGDALLIWLSTSTSSAWSFKNPYTTLGTGNSGVSKYLIPGTVQSS